MTFSDYKTASRIAQLLNARGVYPRAGIRHLTVQQGSIVKSFYQVIPLP